jgi:hypothetical protein
MALDDVRLVFVVRPRDRSPTSAIDRFCPFGVIVRPDRSQRTGTG